MTEIKIKRLCLENFKCHKNLTLNFAGGNASIYGDNATGKTSVYDALTWLLFSKDSAGNGEKNIEIKPLDEQGEVKDHLAVTAVEALLDVNGEEVSLRRTYKEVWSTKRGRSEATYDGNTSEYYVSGVPCKRNAFQEKVNELVSEETFRMLTSVSHFASQISWQERRGVLFNVAGVMDDNAILATNEQFQTLVEGMGRLSLEDYKRKLLAEKRGFVGAKTEVPARISECQKTIEDLEAMDFAGARAVLEGLNAQKESLAAQIMAIEHDSAADQKRLEIREAQLEITAMESENRAYRAAQVTGTVDVEALNARRLNLQSKLNAKEMNLKNEASYISSLEKRIAESRDRWISTNGETFTGGSCPTCGQVLPEKQFRAAMERFDANKKGRLGEIEKTASSYKETKAQAEDRLERGKQEIQQLEEELSNILEKLAAAEAAKVEPRDMDGYKEKVSDMLFRVEELNKELFDIVQASSAVKEKLRRDMAEVNGQIRAQMDIISKESLLEYSRKRIEQLREDARNSAECLEAIEKMLFLMDEYARYKTRFVEDSINGMFRLARFRLFREQANGGIEDRCDVVYDGVPYMCLNNGMKTNIGIDIINTLSQAYGVKVPLFVDNAESVTRLESCGSQIIRLVVSENDKELRVNYEN